MDSESFRTRVERVHRDWLGNMLGLADGDDIDLAGDNTCVELKCRLGTYDHRFAVHHYQLDTFKDLHPGKELWWELLVYRLSIPVQKIKKNIGKQVTWAPIRADGAQRAARLINQILNE